MSCFRKAENQQDNEIRKATAQISLRSHPELVATRDAAPGGLSRGRRVPCHLCFLRSRRHPSRGRRKAFLGPSVAAGRGMERVSELPEARAVQLNRAIRMTSCLTPNCATTLATTTLRHRHKRGSGTHLLIGTGDPATPEPERHPVQPPEAAARKLFGSPEPMTMRSRRISPVLTGHRTRCPGS